MPSPGAVLSPKPRVLTGPEALWTSLGFCGGFIARV